MSSHDESIYYDLGIALSWIPTITLFSMYGAYISCTNIIDNSYSKLLRWEMNMFYRPIVFCTIISIIIALIDISPRLKNSLIIFYINTSIFLISDLLILRRKPFLYIFTTIIIAMWNCVSLFLILGDFMIEAKYIYFLLASITILIIYLMIKVKVISLIGLLIFIRNINKYLFINLKSNMSIVLSSLTIGVLSTIDRLTLSFFNISKHEFANYFALVSLTIPINYFAAVYVKYIMLGKLPLENSLLISKSNILVYSFVFICGNSIVVYLQGLYIDYYTNYNFCVYTQFLLNTCALLLFNSKRSVALLYRSLKSSKILYTNLFCIVIFFLSISIGFNSAIDFALIKFITCLLYVLILYIIGRNTLCSE